jgi:hypothetical protein
VDRLLAAVGVAPPVPSEFEGLGTVANLVARGLGIAIMPRLAVGAYERRLVVRELPAGLDLARDIYAVARTASVARPSVAVIISALRGAARSISARANPADPVLADPVLADPVLADPVLADPAPADIVLADPVRAEPVTPEPVPPLP